MTRAFFDSNILVYALSDEDHRSGVAKRLLRRGGAISIQSLNELANVLVRKLRWGWPDVLEALGSVRDQCETLVVLDDDLHRDGLRLAERHRLSVYDGMIVAAALVADCDTLYSEDMHDGLTVDGRLRIVNPFASA